ncbi:TauD/TfdA family dioxygenase [Pseudomonas syringae]|uniref:TauD/TfdA family dioxygenase n=1 Tax=Pseudomonas syringae TaxID=317 RepID=UPI003F75477E
MRAIRKVDLGLQLKERGYALLPRFDSSYRLIDCYPSHENLNADMPLLQKLFNGISDRLKYYLVQPIIMTYENDGQAFTHITPARSDQKSMTALRGHTDGAFLHLPDTRGPKELAVPELIGLFCIRNPAAVSTTVYPLGELKQRLSKKIWLQLQQPLFQIGVQASWNMPPSFDLHSLARPLIIMGEDGYELIRFSHSGVRSLTPKAEVALQELKSTLPSVEVNLNLNPGDLLLIHNHRSVHGREAAPNIESMTARRRWLLRFYAEDMNTL